MEANKTKRSNRRVLLLVILGMAAINVVLIYLILRNKNQEIAYLETEVTNQKTELTKLETRLREQINETKQLEDQNQDNRILLDSLEQTLAEVVQDRDSLQRTTNYSFSQLSQVRQKIQAYEVLLRKKDERIKELQYANEVMQEQNTDLKNEKNVLIEQVTDEQKRVERMQRKIDDSAVLRAENLNVSIIDDRGKLQSGGQYKSKRIDRLNVTYNIARNNLAKIGNKDVYIRVLEPAGTLLINPQTSGSFDANGQSLQYSSKDRILFDNSSQTYTFQFSRTGNYQAGTHRVEIYADGTRIGVGTFQVR